MKLSALSTKLTCIKHNAVRVLAVAALAGAVLTAAAPAAQAQHVAFGIQIGGPRYVAPAPVYYGNGYYERQRIEEAREARIRQEQWEQHERWENAQRYDRDRFNRDNRFHDYDRDHDNRNGYNHGR